MSKKNKNKKNEKNNAVEDNALLNEETNKENVISEETKTSTDDDLAKEDVKKDKSPKEEKEISKGKKYLLGLRAMAIYFGVFVVSISLSELFLRFQMSGTVLTKNLYFLFFVPAEALFFTALVGFFKNIGNKISLPLVLGIINVYYCIQFVYFRIFGSLFSVSMVGMGTTAVGNFFWAMEEILIQSLIFIVIFLAPTVTSIFLALVKKIKFKGYPILLHVGVLLLAVGFWFLGIEGLKCFGTDRQSAYHVFVDGAEDTDSTATSFGTLTTFLVESGAYYFGIGNSDTTGDIQMVNASNIEESFALAAETIPEPEEPKDETEEDNKEEVQVEEPEEIVYDPWINENFDFAVLSENEENSSIKNMYDFFLQSEPTLKNEYTGIFEGYNLIYICAEGFWKYACDEKVTPTLYMMANNGIVLDNYYNSFLNTTTNGEFAFATSLWPDVSRYAMAGTDIGSFPQSASKYMPYGLGDLFMGEGVNTYAFHNYYGTYYRRNLSWPNLGYQTCKFMGDMKFTSTWPSSDLEMIEQSFPYYQEEEKFLAYYMTFSGHGPYNGANVMANRNLAEVKEILGDDAQNYNSEALCYLACNLELEKAMKELLRLLEEKGCLDNTVIVLTGDHYPYYLSEAGRNSLVGFEMTGLEQYHSSCIIYNSSIEEPIHNANYCCNVDIVPTMLNLFNIPFDSRLLMGTDVFSTGNHTAVLYNKSFINDNVTYDSSTKEAVWNINTSLYCEEALDAYLDNYLALNDSKYLASINIIKNNFYLELWKDAGLLTDEEVANENARSASVIQADQAQNEKEAEEQRLREEAEAAAAAAAAEAEAQQTE